MIPTRHLIVLTLFTTLALASQWTPERIERTVVQSYGCAVETFSTQLRLPKPDTVVSAHLMGVNRTIATRVQINSICTPPTGFNITVTVEMDGNLGYTNFTMLVKTSAGRRYELPGSLDVIGVKLAEPRKMAASTNYAINAELYCGRGTPEVKLSDCRVDVLGRAAAFEKRDVTVIDNSLIIGNTREGQADAKVTVDCPTIVADGENAETEMIIGPDMKEKKRQSVF